MKMSIQDRIAQIYYTYGLFCASHSYSIICSVIFIVLIACYPLTKVPLPGNAPLEYSTPVQTFLEQRQMTSRGGGIDKASTDQKAPPRWYSGIPIGFVQQIIFKGTVSPWKPDQMVATDAFRAPLSKVFEIIDELNSFKFTHRNVEYSLPDLCLHMSEPVDKSLHDCLPSFSCLVLSPANLWNVDSSSFREDAELMKTITQKFGQTLDTPPNVLDILFGIPWKATGLKKYYLRNRRRIISFAVTIIFKSESYNHKFIQSLRHHLETVFPNSRRNANNSAIDHLVHIYFKDFNYFVEYTPLMVTYLVLLLYLYFSVRKIEMVKSKWGLALSAVATVIASLLMSVSICTLFGLTTTLNRGEIFPYLVVIIGLENVLVVTKSVVSTPVHLEVRYRIAQGLQKEGWSITKNLTTELLIILVGFFTFVPAIQEFCLFAVVGLLSDFFLQMSFFATVLSVDIRRMELSDLHKKTIHTSIASGDASCDPIDHSVGEQQGMKSRTTHGSRQNLSSPEASSFAYMEDEFFNNPTILQLPRRLQVWFFLARTRIVQRLIMLGTVIWIILILYKAGLIAYLTKSIMSTIDDRWLLKNTSLDYAHNRSYLAGKYDAETGSLEHTDLEMWRQLSYKHWPTVFGFYNMSLRGRFVTIVPSIHLSSVISPEEALKIRHPNEELRTGNLEGAVNWEEYLPGMKSNDVETRYYMFEGESLITVCLGLLSVFLTAYFMFKLYKCLSSRRYDKWRQSWNKSRQWRRKGGERQSYVKQIQESIPLILKGHLQDVECVKTDGQLIVSACLGGSLLVWDSFTGECIMDIQRCSASALKGISNLEQSVDADSDFPEEGYTDGNTNADLFPNFESNSAPTLERNNPYLFDELPDLSSTIDSDFATSATPSPYGTPDTSTFSGSQGFDFSTRFEGVYKEHLNLMEQEKIVRNKKKQIEFPDVQFSLDDVDSRNSGSAAVASNEETDFTEAPAIWCLCFKDELIIVGCGNGRIELWDSSTGDLKCLYEEHQSSVTGLCIEGSRVVASRLDGSIDFFNIESLHDPALKSCQQTGLHTRGSVRHPSTHGNNTKNGRGDIGEKKDTWREILRCKLLAHVQAHQKPITALHLEGGRVVSASDDRTLKVFRLEDWMCLYTLYGHHSSITALYLDKGPPYSAASGSKDTTIRLWDLLTGCCVHKLCAHDEPVISLTCSLHYVISQGQDFRLCVWNRSRGQLLHDIQLDIGLYSQQMVLLTDKLLVLGGQGYLYLWDIYRGQLKKQVKLGGSSEHADCVRFIQAIDHTVVCDYGNELRVTNFPTVLEKND